MITLPAELKQLIDHADMSREIKNHNGARGLMVHVLNEYCGDDQRRRTFTKAVFGCETSHDLKDYQIAAFLAWKDHPQARSEVNRIIADYLKEQGQAELFAI